MNFIFNNHTYNYFSDDLEYKIQLILYEVSNDAKVSKLDLC